MSTRFLGIDYGEKRVGLALSDETGRFALPYSVIKNTSRLVEEVVKICAANNVGVIILGESKNWQGQDNLIMKRINYFKTALEKETGLAVIYEPEFLTSAAAERLAGKTEMLDASAAALILSSYLERLKSNH